MIEDEEKELLLLKEVRVLKRLVDVAMDIEKNSFKAENTCLFFADQDISYMQVVLGENHPRCKALVDLKEKVQLKIKGAKDACQFY